MFCDACGNPVHDHQKFCPKCGKAVSAASRGATGARSAPISSSDSQAIALIGCIIMVVVSFVWLHILTALLATISIVVCGFGFRFFKISLQKKLSIFGVIVLALIISNSFESWQERKEQTRKAEVQRLFQEQATAEAVRKKAEFESMPAVQHLEIAKKLLVLNSAPALITEAMQHIDAIDKSNPLYTQAVATRQHYLDDKKRRDLEASKRQAEQARQQAILNKAVRRVLRDQLAKSMESTMLDEGYNMDITAIGPDHTTLRIKYVLVSKVFAHQFSKKAEIFEGARAAGFKHIVITDGYDESWSWTL